MKRAARRYYGTPRNTTVAPIEPRGARLKGLRNLLCVVLAVPLLAWSGDQALAWASTSPAFRIERLILDGRVNADRDQLEQAAALLGQNVFAADLSAARERLLDTGWVVDVALRRVLPDGIHVRLQESVPTALEDREGRLSLLDARGCVIEDDVARERFGLPLLRGAATAEDRRRGVVVLASMAQRLPGHEGQLEAVDVSQEDRVTLALSGHPPIHVLGADSIDALLGYLRHAEELRARHGEVAYVDARWRDRLFLGPPRASPGGLRGA